MKLLFVTLRATWWFVCLVVATGGCSSLTIEVRLLNGAYWSSSEYITSVDAARIADSVASISDGRFGTRRETLKQLVRDTITTMADQDLVAKEQVQTLGDNYGLFIDRQFNEARRKIEDSFARLSL